MNYSKGDVILLSYPFTDLTKLKVRPAVVAGASKKYSDIFIVPITSRIDNLSEGEFIISDWESIGLNVVSAIKRGCFLLDSELVRLELGKFSKGDIEKLNKSLKNWLKL